MGMDIPLFFAFLLAGASAFLFHLSLKPRRQACPACSTKMDVIGRVGILGAVYECPSCHFASDFNTVEAGQSPITSLFFRFLGFFFSLKRNKPRWHARYMKLKSQIMHADVLLGYYLVLPITLFALWQLSLANELMRSMYMISFLTIFPFQRKKHHCDVCGKQTDDKIMQMKNGHKRYFCSEKCELEYMAKPLVEEQLVDSTRRKALKALGLAGLFGAGLLTGKLSDVMAASPATPAGVVNGWAEVGSASAIVFVDNAGYYYVKDAGAGLSQASPQIGQLIVNQNIITSYGASLGAGTAGASTQTAGIQEAINSLPNKMGKIYIAPGTYYINAGITLPANSMVMIEGAGSGDQTATTFTAQTVIIASSSFPANTDVFSNPTANTIAWLQLSHLMIQMASGSGARHCINAGDTGIGNIWSGTHEQMGLFDVVIAGFSNGAGVYANGGANLNGLSMDSVQIKSCEYGYYGNVEGSVWNRVWLTASSVCNAYYLQGNDAILSFFAEGIGQGFISSIGYSIIDVVSINNSQSDQLSCGHCLVRYVGQTTGQSSIFDGNPVKASLVLQSVNDSIIDAIIYGTDSQTFGVIIQGETKSVTQTDTILRLVTDIAGYALYFWGTSSSQAVTISGDVAKSAGAIAPAGSQPTSAFVRIENLVGFNPVGFITAPAVPASGTTNTVTNTNPYPVEVFINGAVTGIYVTPAGQTQTQIFGSVSNATVRLNPGDAIALTYTTAPTWTWYGL